MKTIIAVVCLVAFVFAEPPPSNSYLPPPPANHGGGYPSGPANQNSGSAPQIIAARNLEGAQERGPQGSQGLGRQRPLNNFGRTNSQERNTGAQARFSPEEPSGYDSNASSFSRNGIEENNSEPVDYNFAYSVNDYQEGTDFGHREERQEEKAHGEYHVVLPDGRKQTVSYEADERGFKPQISYEESEDYARSGYDSNASNLRSAGNPSSQGYSSEQGYTSNHGNQGYSADQGYTSNHGNRGNSPNTHSSGY